MKVKKKKTIKIISFLVVVFAIIAFVSTIIFNLATKKDIEYVLKSEHYSYLPLEAKNYIKEVYEDSGEIILTEKNKEEDEPYLSPEFIKYLESGEASEYGYIPEEFIVEHSYKNDAIIEKHGVDNAESTESLSYYNLRDDGYITNIYDQGNEGLCWAFSSSTSLESHLAIKTNKQTMLTFSEKQVDYATTLNGALDVGSNPYITKYTTILGINLNEGGNMLRFANSTAIGISPIECRGNCSNGADYNKNNNIVDNKYWKYDYSFNSTLSPYEVLNFDNTQYSLEESLFFNPLVNQDADEVNALVKIIKNQIVNNGSLYVGVGAYTNLSVEYTPTDGEKVLNADGKNVIYYIPYGWNPENAMNHAISVIGWDDNYTHSICLNKTAFEITDATKKSDGTYACSSSNATLHTIKGAWITQNSWGEEKDTYIYLPYNSMKSAYSSISKVGEIDFDNSYRSTGWRTYIDKGDTKEVVSKIKLFISSYNQTIKVYYDESDNDIIINDGSESSYGTLLATLNTTHPGLYTIDILDKGIVLDENVTRAMFSFDTDDTDYYYYASVHTNNVEEDDKYIDISKISKVHEEILAKCNLNDNKCISTPQQISFDDNNVFNIYGVTRNLTSDDNLTFKVLNKDKEDVTNLFHFFRNFSVSNYVNALISYNDDNVAIGTYTIEVYYNGTKYDELEWKLEKHNNIIAGLGTEKNPYKIRNVQDLNDIRNHTTTNDQVSEVIYGYYILDNDLDLTYDTQNKNGLFYNDGDGWEPIYKFAGNFDGNNHVIIGLKSRGERNVGLFGTVFGSDNYIKNLHLKNADVSGGQRVGTLIGGIYEAKNIEIHDISVTNGNVNASEQIAGGIIGYFEAMKDSSYNFYNLFNNSNITAPEMAGGIIGFESSDSNYNAEDSNIEISITDTVNLGNVTGSQVVTEAASVGGIISWIKYSDVISFKNIITIGNYSSSKKHLGDVFGGLLEFNKININNVYYKNNLYGSSWNFTGITKHDISENTQVTFNDIININAIEKFEHNNDWIYPVVDGIKRIPMLKSMVNYFDFTEKIENFELGIASTINIKDMIKPNITSAKNLTLTYDEECLNISSSGVITPKKLGATTIKVDSMYDGYSDEIQVTIKDVTNIIYNSNNEANENVTQQVYLNTSINLEKNTFEYKGHIFKNWNTKADGTGDTYTDEQIIESGITEPLTLHAQWTEIDYMIHLDGNGGITSANKTMIDWDLKYPTLGKISPLNGGFKKENYLVDSWNTKADGTGIKFLTEGVNFDELQFDENYELTLYAQWKKVEWKIYFNPNGGNETTMTHQVYEFDETKALDLNTFTKKGHTFKNWNTKEDGTGDTYTDGQVIMLPKDKMVLYAQWEPNEQTVTFDANGGTGTMDNQQFYYNVSQKVSKNLFEREHYTFKNWNTKADGMGISYTDEQSIKVTDNITLYAQWSPKKYSITFDANGGTGTMDNQTIDYDVEKELNDVKFNRDGYIFKNWNTKADGSETSYTNQQNIKLNGNITLYAQWEEGTGYVINKYSVDETNRIIKNIPINTTEEQFRSNVELNTGYTMEIVKQKDKSNIGTNTLIKIYKNEQLYTEFTAIVKGDITGDGLISLADMSKFYNYYQGNIIMNKYFELSADVNGDGKFSLADLSKFYNYYQGKINKL